MSQQLQLFENKNRFDYESKEFEDVKNVKPIREYTGLELFAGAGGLALGLEHAGFNNVASIELDKDATQTLRDNRPDWKVIEADINIVAEDGIEKYMNYDGEIDLISG